MDLFAYDDYKAFIKSAARAHGSLTLKAVAGKLRIQYTYLSKVLNHDKAHLSEDHVFQIAEIFDVGPDGIEFLGFLRARATTSDTKRKQYLEAKIHALRRRRTLDVPHKRVEGDVSVSEASYLFDPFALLLHVAMNIPDYREHPRRLASLLGISTERLDLLVNQLKELGFLEETTTGELRVLKNKTHYGPDHPLMRAHQQIMRSAAQGQLLRLREGEKQSFVSLFTGDLEGAHQIYIKFQEFLKQAQNTVSTGKPKNVFQMQFDLFRWT